MKAEDSMRERWVVSEQASKREMRGKRSREMRRIATKAVIKGRAARRAEVGQEKQGITRVLSRGAAV